MHDTGIRFDQDGTIAIETYEQNVQGPLGPHNPTGNMEGNQ